MDTALLVQLLIGGGLLSGIGMAYKAWVEHRVLKATAAARAQTADNDTASATALVIDAARELVDPLRKELAEERRTSAIKVREVRTELRAATAEARQFRQEIAALRRELSALHIENAAYRARIAELERTT